MGYLVYYDKRRKKFLVAKESKALSDESGVHLDMVKLSREQGVLDMEHFAVGPAEFAMSRRGGKRGNVNNLKNVGKEKEESW